MSLPNVYLPNGYLMSVRYWIYRCFDQAACWYWTLWRKKHTSMSCGFLATASLRLGRLRHRHKRRRSASQNISPAAETATLPTASIPLPDSKPHKVPRKQHNQSPTLRKRPEIPSQTPFTPLSHEQIFASLPTDRPPVAATRARETNKSAGWATVGQALVRLFNDCQLPLLSLQTLPADVEALLREADYLLPAEKNAAVHARLASHSQTVQQLQHQLSSFGSLLQS